MYELMILTFLMRGPMHGYLIAKIINDIIGPFAKVSNGRLYPLMAKLEAEGMIVPVEDAPGGHERRQRAYQITEAGRERFHQVMLDTTSNPSDYPHLFWVKVMYFEFLQPAEQLYLVDHYINFCQTHIFHLTGEITSLAREARERSFMTPHQLEVTLETMRHLQDRWRLELEAAKNWRARYVEPALPPEQTQNHDHQPDPDYHYNQNHQHTNA
jgi:DNA-binding PadR family transcriptional regulator